MIDVNHYEKECLESNGHYLNIINGHGFGIEDARPSIEIVWDIHNSEPIGLKGDYHPFAKLPLSAHPFGW